MALRLCLPLLGLQMDHQVHLAFTWIPGFPIAQQALCTLGHLPNPKPFYNFKFIIYLLLGWYVCPGTLVEVKGQLARVGYFLPSCEPLEIDSGLQSGWRVLLPTPWAVFPALKFLCFLLILKLCSVLTSGIQLYWG